MSTQSEIYDSMQAQAAKDEVLQAVDTTSKTSVLRVILYIVSFSLASFWELLTTHKSEVDESIENKQRHDVLWYKAKALGFQLGYELVTEMDYYDNTNLTDEEIEASKIIKYAFAIQADDRSVVTIKIADENKEPLTSQNVTAFKSYINDVLDVGVNVEIINAEADALKVDVTIYYDAKVLADDGSLITDSSTYPVTDALLAYVESLNFNGAYADVYLTDELQTISGVKIPKINSSEYKYGALDWQMIEALQVPYAGSFSLSEDNITINYIAL